MSSFHDPASRHVADRPGGEPAPLRDIAALQRRFVDAVAELRRIHDELQSAKWLMEYDTAEVGEPPRVRSYNDARAAAGRPAGKN